VTALALVALATAVVAVLVRRLVPVDRGRGVLVFLALSDLVAAGGQTAPSGIRSIALLVAVVLLVCAVPGQVEERRTAQAPLAPGLLLFSGSVLLTGLVHPSTVEATLWLAALALPAMLAARRCGDRDVSVVKGGVVVLAVIETCLAAWEHLVVGGPRVWDYVAAGQAPLANPFLDGQIRVAGSLSHPIPLGALCAVAALVALTSGRRTRTQNTLLLLLCSSGLLLSGSRSAVLALLAGAVVVLLQSAPDRRLRRLLVVAPLVALAAPLAGADLAEAASSLLASGSWTNRAEGIASVPGLLGRAPSAVLLGEGFGSEDDLRLRGLLNQNGFASVDNQFVTTLATQGLLGTALLALSLVGSWVRGDRGHRAVVVAFLVLCCSFDLLRWPAVLVLFLVLFALPTTPAPETTASDALTDRKEPAPCPTTSDAADASTPSWPRETASATSAPNSPA